MQVYAGSSQTRLEARLDRWAWLLAGSIAGLVGLLNALGPKEPTAPGLLGQVLFVLPVYFLFVFVLPVAAVAGAVAPLWCIFRRSAPTLPRIHRVLVSILAAGEWYWFLQAHIVELS